MDDIVVRGMARWPNVPAVYGWLSLDRRGQWRIKGDPVSNPLVTDFIGRNYARDERGCWYFQNGPQRVFVNLDYTPIVLRVVSSEGAALAFATHSGKSVAHATGAWMDETGALLLATEHGLGTVHDRDLERLLPALVGTDGQPVAEDALDALLDQARQGQPVPLWLKLREARLRVEPIAARQVPARFNFVAQPEPPAGEEVCR